MSWSVSASGTPAFVKQALAEQFKYPLDSKSGLSIQDERESVRRVSETINHVLDTFDPEQQAQVTAYGHWGSSNYDTKAGSYQNVSVSISPYTPPPAPPSPAPAASEETAPASAESAPDSGSDPAQALTDPPSGSSPSTGS